MNAHFYMVTLILPDIKGRMTGALCKCGAPIIATPKIKTPFCWLCRTDDLCAMQGREELRRLQYELDQIKFKESGIVSETREEVMRFIL